MCIRYVERERDESRERVGDASESRNPYLHSPTPANALHSAHPSHHVARWPRESRAARRWSNHRCDVSCRAMAHGGGWVRRSRTCLPYTQTQIATVTRARPQRPYPEWHPAAMAHPNASKLQTPNSKLQWRPTIVVLRRPHVTACSPAACPARPTAPPLPSPPQSPLLGSQPARGPPRPQSSCHPESTPGP